MIYPIIEKGDVSLGTTLVISIPEEDVDKKALYTIQEDTPDFIVPFHYRSVDGNVECTYIPGNRSKLQYRFGQHSPEAYIDFWDKILKPVIDCTDWFLKPSSFVMDKEYLYVDKNSSTVSYIYVPTKRDCDGQDALKHMILELSRRNTVSDAEMENKILRAVMESPRPESFLEMLHSGVRREKNNQHPMQQPSNSMGSVGGFAVNNPQMPIRKPEAPQILPQQRPASPQEAGRNIPAAPKALNELHINIEDNTAKKKAVKEKPIKEKAPKRKGLFASGRKKEERIPDNAVHIPNQYADPRRPIANVPPAPVAAPSAVPMPKMGNFEADGGVTVLAEESEGVRLRLVGNPSMPQFIEVKIEPGRAFTIGRFDVSVGYKQSDFEFDKSTKAVSRHHAAIERGVDGNFTIIDLASSAGTFINGEKLTPNMRYGLQNGCRVSFGTSGADYIWECG